MKNTAILTDFNGEPVTYLETLKVKKGVSCEVYSFKEDNSKDLGIVTVKSEANTPLQKVLKGEKTIEGLISGEGVLVITKKDGLVEKYEMNSDSTIKEIAVDIGEIMQWENKSKDDLVFYEICSPPYEDGRYENIA